MMCDSAGLAPGFKFTEDDVKRYEEQHGTKAAWDWLILITPDKFDGDYDRVYRELFSRYYFDS